MTFRHFFFNNFFLKLFSVAAGTIIWFAIHHSITDNLDFSEPGGQQFVKQVFNIPISALKQEGDPRNFSFSPTNATLTVAGEMSDFRTLKPGSIKILVDVGDFTGNGPVQLDLNPQTPKDLDLNVISFKPHSVTVNVDTNSR